jgi:O-antigen/teichoic acid export membrane protein
MAGAVPPLFLMFAWVMPYIESAVYFRISAIRQVLSYGLRSFGIDLLGTMALQVDQILVISLLSPAAMGSYGVMLSLSRMFNLFQASVVMVLFPKSAGKSAESIIEMAEYSARISTIITGFCCFIVSIFGFSILKLFYGAAYARDARTFRLLLLEVTISGAVFILAQAFMALGHPGIVTILQGTGLSLSVPLMLWLVPRLGLEGAALSLLFSTLARFILVCLGFKFVLKLRFPHLLPTGVDIRLLFSTCRNFI